MPLKVMDLVSLRQELMDKAGAGVPVTVLCREAGISRETFYVWKRRWEAGGAAGLVPQSRRPRSSPGQLAAALEDLIVALAKERPRYGPDKIRALLAGELAGTGTRVPAKSTVQQVLLRRGVAREPRPRTPARDSWQFFRRAHPNELWQIDATAHQLANGRLFWVIDILDDHSRYLLAARVAATATAELAWRALAGAVAEHGMPAQVLCDNGLIFTGRALGREVTFERQARAAGIRLAHGRAYHPQTQGKIERQHRTQNDWITDHRRPASLAAAQDQLDAYRHDYNHHRPHQALGQETPASAYTPGIPVALPLTDLQPADAFRPGCLMRKVDTDGTITYQRTRLHIGGRFAGLSIGLHRDGRDLTAYYGASAITTFVIKNHPRPPATSPGQPH
jgi:transposase InsO family protein